MSSGRTSGPSDKKNTSNELNPSQVISYTKVGSNAPKLESLVVDIGNIDFSRPETIPQSFYSNSPVGSQSTESPLTTTPSKAKLPKKDKAGKKKLRNESISEVKNAQSVSNGDVLPDHLIESTGALLPLMEM
jgi:hypothetical protein